MNDTLSLVGSYRRQKKYYNRCQQCLRNFLQERELTLLEADILFSLYNDAGCNTVTAICNDIDKTKGVVSRSCEHLCHLGLIDATTDAVDRRIIHFRLLPPSGQVIEDALKYLAEIFVPKQDVEAAAVLKAY